MIRNWFKSTLVLMACLLSLQTQAQTIFSPYTAQGLGDTGSSGLTNNLGMAGLGVSYGTIWNLNIVNPALLTKNSNFTTFQIGTASDLRRLEDDSGEQTNFEGGLNYIILGFPVVRDRLVVAAGYRPLTSVGYQIQSFTPISNSPDVVPTNFEGSGGLSEAFLSGGIKLNENFSVGGQASYVFGSIREEQTPLFVADTASNFTNVRRLSTSDFSFKASALYTGKLGKETYLNLGGVYQFESELDADQLLLIERTEAIGFQALEDTVSNLEGQITYPQSVWGGISFEKKYKWAVGVNYRYTNWNNFEDFNGSNDGLDNSNMWIVGGEITPDINDVNSYFNRMSYRLGLRYEETQFIADGSQVDDFGMSFGLGLPVTQASFLNMALWVGRRGWDDGQLQENYIRGYLGFTFNDKWFIRRKFN